MSEIITGFENKTWRIIKYDGVEPVHEERIPQSEATEEQIVALLKERAKAELTAREVQERPELYEIRRDYDHGKRIILSAGENPHYTASLWRGDEMVSEGQTRPIGSE